VLFIYHCFTEKWGVKLFNRIFGKDEILDRVIPFLSASNGSTIKYCALCLLIISIVFIKTKYNKRKDNMENTVED
jgi:hypothetical protein